MSVYSRCYSAQLSRTRLGDHRFFPIHSAMEPAIGVPVDNWRGQIAPMFREQKAMAIFGAMHPNCWACPDLFIQATAIEYEIYRCSSSAGDYFATVSRIADYLFSRRGILYQNYIGGFAGFVMAEFHRSLSDRFAPMLPMPPVPILEAPAGPLPTFQLPPAPPIPTLLRHPLNGHVMAPRINSRL